jgi:hypothetical protein
MKHAPGSYRDLVENSEWLAAFNYRLYQIKMRGSKTKVSMDEKGVLMIAGEISESIKEHEECRI